MKLNLAEICVCQHTCCSVDMTNSIVKLDQYLLHAHYMCLKLVKSPKDKVFQSPTGPSLGSSCKQPKARLQPRSPGDSPCPWHRTAPRAAFPHPGWLPPSFCPLVLLIWRHPLKGLPYRACPVYSTAHYFK